MHNPTPLEVNCQTLIELHDVESSPIPKHVNFGPDPILTEPNQNFVFSGRRILPLKIIISAHKTNANIESKHANEGL